MRILAFALIFALAQANDDYFGEDKDYHRNDDNTDYNSQSSPFDEINSIRNHHHHREHNNNNNNNNGDFVDETDGDYVTPVRLNAPAPFNKETCKKQTQSYLDIKRRLHAAGPVSISSTLSLGAQAHADKLAKAGKAVPDKTAKHNQTVCGPLSKASEAANECINMLYAKVMNYYWAEPKINKDNKDFVNLVYKSTKEVGVGVSQGPKKKVYIVLFYGTKAVDSGLHDNVRPFIDVYEAKKDVKCGAGYSESKGSCYKRHSDKKTWMGAVVECAKESAVVSDVTDAATELALKSLKSKDPKGEAWIALNDRLGEGIYTNVNGRPITHMNWKQGEPQGLNQNCVSVDLKSAVGIMSDRKCFDKLEFICKKPLLGYVLYEVNLVLEHKYESDYANVASLTFQKLKENVEKLIQSIYKDSKTVALAAIHVLTVSDSAVPKKPATVHPMQIASVPASAPFNNYASYPQQPAQHYMGKREAVPTGTPAPTRPTSAMPSSSMDDEPMDDDSMDDDMFGDKSKKAKAPAKPKLYVTLNLKFAPKNKATPTIDSNPPQAITDAIKKGKGKLPAPINVNAKVLSVKLLPPGSEPNKEYICPTTCATTCQSMCSPQCCFQTAYSPYSSPCMGSTCTPAAPAKPTKAPKMMSFSAFRGVKPKFALPKWGPPPKPVKAVAAPCTPTIYNPCTTQAYGTSYGTPYSSYGTSYQTGTPYNTGTPYQTGYPTYGAPCVPSAMNPCQRKHVPGRRIARAAVQNLRGYLQQGGKKKSVVPKRQCISYPCGSSYQAMPASMAMPMPFNPFMAQPMAQSPVNKPNPKKGAKAPAAPPASPCSPFMGSPCPPMGMPMAAPMPFAPPMPMAQPMPMPMAPPMPMPMAPPMQMPMAQHMPMQMPYGQMPYGQMPYGQMPYGQMPCNPMQNPRCPPKKPKAAPKKPVAAPKTVNLQGYTYPPQSFLHLPALPPPAMPGPMMVSRPITYNQVGYNPCTGQAVLSAPCQRRSPQKHQKPKPKSKTARPSKKDADAAPCYGAPCGSSYGATSTPGTSYGTGYGTGYGNGYGTGYGTGTGAGYGTGYGAGYGTGYGNTGSTYNTGYGAGVGDVKHISYNINAPIQSMPFNPYGSAYGTALPSPFGVPLIPGLTYPKCIRDPTNPCKSIKFKTPKFKSIRIKLKDAPIEIRVPQNPNLASLMQIPVSNKICSPTCTPTSCAANKCPKRCCVFRG